MKKDKASFATKAIHFGSESDKHQALNSPIYMTSTFTFDDVAQADDTFSFRRKAYVYTRGGNPTVNLLERRLAALEEGADAVAFASGMAAITSVLLSFTSNGNNIVAHRNLYGSTYSVTANLFPRYGVTTKYIDMTDLEQVVAAIDDQTKVLFFETPTNPSLEIIDIAAIVAIAEKRQIKVVVDNTFSSPYLQRPLTMGADVVVHSTTKYICGHGDAVGGIAVAKDADYIHELKFGYMCELGGVMSPFNAWLLLRGLKTLVLRMQQHEKNALAVVDYLTKQPKIAKVLYPSLANHPNHEVAVRQMQGFGGILSFELHGEANVAREFVENMQLAKLAVSLGDAETLVEVPALMTHRFYPEEKFAEFGFTTKTVRISTGLEDSADIIADIDQALTKLK